MRTVRIGIAGCAGRMGRALVHAIADDDGVEVAGGTEAAGSSWIGHDVGEAAGLEALGIAVAEDAAAVFAAVDAMLDFTAAAAAKLHAQLAAETGTPLVLGTTGLGPEEDRAVAIAAKRTAVVRAANMSLGVNLLLALTRSAAAALGPDFDAEVAEIHHRDKRDAPSGTALALGHAVAEARGQMHDKVAAYDREGARRPGAIGYSVVRAGNVVGEHTVIFAADNERIELVHKAGDRAIFARGAITAARWAQGKPPGLYCMDNVLGLKG